MAKYMPKPEMPEDDDDPKYLGKPKVPGKFGPAFSRNSGKDKVMMKHRKLALKNKIKGTKTAHQMHVEHEAHMTHKRNEARKNMNSKNPYSD